MKSSGPAPLFRRFIDFLIYVVVGVLLLALFFLISRWQIARAVERDRAEISAYFEQAIRNGEVENVEGGKFSVRQRHFGDPFFLVSFVDPAGQRAGYFVSWKSGAPGAWEFKELMASKPTGRVIFYREKLRD